MRLWRSRCISSSRNAWWTMTSNYLYDEGHCMISMRWWLLSYIIKINPWQGGLAWPSPCRNIIDQLTRRPSPSSAYRITTCASAFPAAFRIRTEGAKQFTLYAIPCLKWSSKVLTDPYPLINCQGSFYTRCVSFLGQFEETPSFLEVSLLILNIIAPWVLAFR